MKSHRELNEAWLEAVERDPDPEDKEPAQAAGSYQRMTAFEGQILDAWKTLFPETSLQPGDRLEFTYLGDEFKVELVSPFDPMEVA